MRDPAQFARRNHISGKTVTMDCPIPWRFSVLILQGSGLTRTDPSNLLQQSPNQSVVSKFHSSRSETGPPTGRMVETDAPIRFTIKWALLAGHYDLRRAATPQRKAFALKR